MRRHRWVVCAVAACGSSPATTQRPVVADQACAAPLPLLAKQHTRNVTQLYIAKLAIDGDHISVGVPSTATSKHGYVNQPAFTADGTGLYFTWRPQGSQADIWYRDLRTGDEHAVTCSSEEEYGAAVTGLGLVVIRVEPDLHSRIVRLDRDGHPGAVLFPDVPHVGAFTWIDDATVALFLADDTGTKLVLGDIATGAIQPVADNVTAAVGVITGSRAISYVDQSGDKPVLVRFDRDSRATTQLGVVPDGVDKVAWLADGSVLVGDGKKILRAVAGSRDWHEIADFTGTIDGRITRVVAGGATIAIVTKLD